MDGAEIQFPEHRKAEKSSLRRLGDVSRAAVSESGAKSKRLAGAGTASGSDGSHSSVSAGGIRRTVAAIAGAKAERNGATGIGPRAKVDGRDSGGSAAGRCLAALAIH